MEYFVSLSFYEVCDKFCPDKSMKMYLLTWLNLILTVFLKGILEGTL
jgi:hypothetical protein